MSEMKNDGPAKASSAVAVQPVGEASSAGQLNAWRPGLWRRLPWTGLLAVLGAVMAAAGMVAVVVLSNGEAVAAWRVQPSVVLAILSAAANILVRYGVSEGAAVAWWVNALRPTSNARELHAVWAHASSLKSALLSGRAFDWLALAGIAASIIPINGPLLQRASTVSSQLRTEPVAFTVPIAQEFPPGYTGTITGRAHASNLLTRNFSAIVKDFTNSVPIGAPDSGCAGRCAGTLRGAGYAIACDAFTVAFNLSTAGAILANGSVNTDITGGADVFATNFTYSEFLADAKPLNFSALFKTTDQCDGELQQRRCTLQPALLRYRVLHTNGTIALDPASSYHDDEVVRLTPATPNSGQGASTHGGMGLVLAALYSSAAHLRFSGAVGYDIRSSGAPAFEYSTAGTDDLTDTRSCPTTWTDPTDSMLATARQLAFRVAIHAADPSNATNLQLFQGHDERPTTVFRSHYLFLALALLFTLLAVAAVVPVFSGWWRLGRQVSLSPLEIAKAFDPSSLSSADSNAPVDVLLKQVGSTRLQYGSIDAPSSAESQKLAFAGPGLVSVPSPGTLYR